MNYISNISNFLFKKYKLKEEEGWCGDTSRHLSIGQFNDISIIFISINYIIYKDNLYYIPNAKNFIEETIIIYLRNKSMISSNLDKHIANNYSSSIKAIYGINPEYKRCIDFIRKFVHIDIDKPFYHGVNFHNNEFNILVKFEIKYFGKNNTIKIHYTSEFKKYFIRIVRNGVNIEYDLNMKNIKYLYRNLSKYIDNPDNLENKV